MRKIISLIAISWLLFLINCAEEEVPVLPYPVIDTNDVTEINSEGATFNAKIISFGKEPILEFGFYWERRSSYTGPPANTQGQEKIIFTGTELKGETFEARITTTLSANVIYIVRAYAKTENYYIRGEPKTFLSLGSGGPSIAEIIPSHAHIRDTVNIRGRNFSFNAFSNIVKFDQFDAKVLDATDSLLTIVVPHQLINKKPVISVSIVGNISKLEEKFELYTPIIQSISKSTLYSLDTIELTGQHFGILPLDNKILINENEATVLSSSRTKLKFIVPLKLSNPITIQLSVAGQIATLDEDIQYLIPVFDSFSPSSAHWGDTITISGDNFYSPNLITQEVFVGTRKATIISADSDKIKFIVPNHLDVQTSKVKMITAGFELENENDLQLLEPKINHISHDQVTFEQLITLKGVGFNSNFSYLSANNHSCQITKISASEITFKIPNTLNTNNGVINLRLNSGNTIIYSLELPAALNLLPPIIESFTPHELQNVGQQITITGQNFSPSVQNNIVRLGDRNLTIRNASTTQLNVEIPSNFISNNRISAFYQNNLTLHTAGQSVTTEEIFTFNYQAAFTRLANFPGELRQHPVSFTIGNKSYMGLGTQNNLALNDLWEYDFETDTWTQKSDFPGTLRRFAKGFGFNGYGYVGFGIASNSSTPYGDLWEYDPKTDQWRMVTETTNNRGHLVFSMVINNELYLGGGLSSNNRVSEKFSKYDPKTDQWIELADIPYNLLTDGSITTTTAAVQNGNGYLFFMHYIPPLVAHDLTVRIINYNPNTNSWQNLNEFKTDYFNIRHSFAVNNEVILSLQTGIVEALGLNSREIILAKYNLSSQTLTPISRPFNLFQGIFMIHYNNQVYFGLGKRPFSPSEYRNQNWKYDPSLD